MSTQQEATDDDENSIALSAIAEQQRFVEFLDRLDAVVPEAILQIDDSGIDVQAVDPAMVSMVDTTLEPDACESYNAGEIRIGVDIERLRDTLGLADSDDDTIELTFDTSDAKFHITGPDFEAGVSGLDPDTVRDPPDIPDLDLDAKFRIEGEKLKRAVEGAGMMGETIAVRWDTDADAALFEAESDIDDVNFDFGADDDLESVENRPDESIGSVLSLTYLEDLVDALDKDESVLVELGDEFPMWMRQDYAAGGCSCLFMIAPRLPGGA